MQQSVKIAVIIPAGPRDDVLDTLDSVVQFTGTSRIVLVVNDTGSSLDWPFRNRGLLNDVAVVKAPNGAAGAYGGLWVKLATGYKWVLSRYRPAVVLRLDSDALLLRPGIETASLRTFSERPSVGLLGCYSRGPDGGVRDFSPAERALRAEMGLRGMVHPRTRTSLRNYVQMARLNGYVDGEHVLGAAYIHSYTAMRSLHQRGWFNLPWMASSKLGEDVIMSLLTRAAGFEIGEFGGPDQPMALKWRGLPAHPKELVHSKALIAHSVRNWGSLTEHEIRGIFAAARSNWAFACLEPMHPGARSGDQGPPQRARRVRRWPGLP